MNLQNKKINLLKGKIRSITKQIDVFQSKVEKTPKAINEELIAILDELKRKRQMVKEKIEVTYGNGQDTLEIKGLNIMPRPNT